MNVLDDWTIFANGSGAERVLMDGHLDRLRPHLGTVPRKPMNHMKLLAVINRQVAAKDNRVSPFCQVAFIGAGDRFKQHPTLHAFTEKGESVQFDMPLILGGLDVTDFAREGALDAQAFFKGETPPPHETDLDVLNERIKRRP
jgi:hypothetical protein